MPWDLDGYFELLGHVQKRRGGNKTHQEIQQQIKTRAKEVKEIKKEGLQLKLFFSK